MRINPDDLPGQRLSTRGAKPKPGKPQPGQPQSGEPQPGKPDQRQDDTGQQDEDQIDPVERMEFPISQDSDVIEQQEPADRYRFYKIVNKRVHIISCFSSFAVIIIQAL